jgi:hypothetical protein
MHENTWVFEHDPEPLSPEADEALRRIRVFLFAIRRPEWVTTAMLAGYTPETHSDGVYRASQVSGERPMWEWREWRALRPQRDPDLPDQVAELESFADRWRERGLAAAAGIVDPEDRKEMLGYLRAFDDYPSRTWRAKVTVACLKDLGNVNEEFYQVVARQLQAEGFFDALPRFEEVLSSVQDYIRGLPVDDVERRDIHEAREDAADWVRKWLQERRQQLAHLDEVDRTFLGLEALVPPPGFEPPLAFLVGFGAEAKA